ncbi:hypothetical protein D9615_007487 [Tricholomella constricta]|uniref:protein-tyrosine-phosphatase n=1 Tax=Tricholomella constricta TaxID=117010 RepID=A0A8H5LXT2_9AGAR|nr:hypothetical protein D9615_007487 [Tricholomella constricta]
MWDPSITVEQLTSWHSFPGLLHQKALRLSAQVHSATHPMLSFSAPNWHTPLNAVTSQRSNRQRSAMGFGRAASPITPRVYLSDALTARNQDQLVRLGITHVVSIVEYNPTIPDIIPAENKLHIRLADESKADILSHLPNTTEFITSVLAENKTNKVLVHCVMGISRSATVVCAYLIASSGMDAREALEHTQAKRGIVCPNLGFRKQLDAYAEGFVGRRHKQGGTTVAKIGGEIAERLRRLKETT